MSTVTVQLSLDGHAAREQVARAAPALPLRPYQEEALGAVVGAEGRGVTRPLVALPTGCHRVGQGLLMHDGSVKAVEDVLVGDRLMGPDGQPRTVLALARGTGPMMEIRPVKGTPWVVNDEHVLTLVETQETSHGHYPSQRGGTIRDVALPDWWQWSRNRKHRHKLFRVPVNFPEREAPPLDPYFLGVVLGDGTLAIPYRLSITTIDPKVLAVIEETARSFGLSVRHEDIQRHVHGRVARNANPILGILRRLGLSPIACAGRFIPDAYRLGSRETRRAVLAGLIDSDGSYRDGGYEFASKSERLAEDVAFVARSLGLAAYVVKRPNGHYRVSISGDCSAIPCRIPRKQASTRGQKKDVLRTGFQVIPTGTVEPFYGFTLSGDGRYLLDDFTVTHNTGKTVCFAHLIDRRPGRALVIAHRDELIQQAAGKLRQVAPTLEVGIVKAEQDQVAADVVVASIQTLARPSRLARLDRDFTTIIVDEAHHVVADTYVAALRHLGVFDDGGPLCVGFTATPERADTRKLGAVWEEIVYQRGILEMIAAGYLCDLRGQMVGTDADLARLRVRHGDLQDAEIAEELLRSGAIGQVAGAYVKHATDRKGLAFTPTVKVAYALAEALAERGVRAEALDGTTNRDLRRAILARLATGQTQVVVNCGVLTEGFDEPSIGCVLIARPTRSRVLYTQMIGRGTRLHPGKDDCLVLDLAGVTARHDLATVAELAGLDQADLEGKTITEALAARQARGEEERGEGGGEETLRLPGLTVKVPMFRSKMRWLTVAGEHVLPCDNGAAVHLVAADGGMYRVEGRRRGREPKVLAEGLSLEYAQGFGEDIARRFRGGALASADASWRAKPPSPKQLAALKKWRIRVPKAKLAQLTAGDVSDLINTAAAKAAAGKAGLR